MNTTGILTLKACAASGGLLALGACAAMGGLFAIASKDSTSARPTRIICTYYGGCCACTAAGYSFTPYTGGTFRTMICCRADMLAWTSTILSRSSRACPLGCSYSSQLGTSKFYARSSSTSARSRRAYAVLGCCGAGCLPRSRSISLSIASMRALLYRLSTAYVW